MHASKIATPLKREEEKAKKTNKIVLGSKVVLILLILQHIYLGCTEKEEKKRSSQTKPFPE